jgi:arylsulfatase A-like enzyme/HEAT repeat protein
LGLVDTALSASALLREFDDALTWLPLAGRQLLLPLGPACLLGCLGVLLLRGLWSQAQRQALGRAGRADRWLGTYVALLALPGLLWLSSQVFAGPRAQKLPGRPLLSIALVVIGLLALRQPVAFLARTREQAPRRLLALLPLSGLTALACLLADRFVLPRLYPWFHQALQLGAFLAAALALWGLDEGRGPAPAADAPGRGLGLTRSRLWLVGLLLSCLLSASLLGRLHRASLLRSYILEQTTIAAALMRPYAASRTGAGREIPAQPMGAVVLPGEDATPPPKVPIGPRLSGRDVFLITVDALRHDRLALLPTVRDLAERGVVFERAYTQVPHTSFALATLLTGKPVYALLTLGQDAASHETLPTVLRRFRYKTAAFYPPSVFYIEHDKLKSLEDSAYGFEYVKYEYLNGARRTDQVLAFLETEKPERAFVWVHYLEPHEPYEPHPDLPPGQATHGSDSDSRRYDGEIAYVDREIRRLLTYLQAHRPGALVLFSADHGEEFSEHGGRYHGTTLYEEQVHVPLLLAPVSGPGISTAPKTEAGSPPADASPPALTALLAENARLLAPRRIAAPVGLLDMAPTLLGLLDIERSARMRGRDLSPWLLTGADRLPGGPIFAEIGRKKMVLLGDDKLICDLSTDACQLFDLGADAGETRNLIAQKPAVLARLRGLLDRSLAEARRFEGGGAESAQSGSPAQAPPALDAQTLSRAKLGDRAVLPVLLDSLGDSRIDAAARRNLLGLIGTLSATLLPPETPRATDPLIALASRERLATLRQALTAASGDPVALRWAAISLLRLSPPGQNPPDGAVLAPVRALILDDNAEIEQRLCGALALAALPACHPSGPRQVRSDGPPTVDCVAVWTTSGVLAKALALQDADRVRPLIELIARSRDPRALPAILSQLDNVLSRADLVRALGTLGQVAAVPALGERLLHDPYVHVRTAAATALGQLASQSPSARSTLTQAARNEREPAVLTAIQAAQKSPHPTH